MLIGKWPFAPMDFPLVRLNKRSRIEHCLQERNFMRYLMLGVLLICGCTQQPQEGPPRYQVSGEVLLNGKPVPAGTVQFEPDATLGNKGPMAIAEIHDGRYETEYGKGIVGGPQKIIVEAFDGQGEPGTSLSNGRPLPGGPFRMKADIPKENGTFDISVKS